MRSIKIHRLVVVAVAAAAGCRPPSGKAPGAAVPASAAVTVVENGIISHSLEIPAARSPHLAFRAGGSGFVAEHHRHSLMVESTGRWSFTARSGDSRKVAPIFFTTARIGGVSTSAPTPTLANDGALKLRHRSAVETLSNTEMGVEQSWSFERRPEGEDLVIRVAVSGHRYRGEKEDGLHFFDEQSGTGVRYGRATWVDANGTRFDIAPRFERDEIVMTVPRDVLARSSYPAVLDPTISSELTVTGPDGGALALAYDTTNQRFLLTWAGGVSGQVLGSRFTPDSATPTLIDGIPFTISGATGAACAVDSDCPTNHCSGGFCTVYFTDTGAAFNGSNYFVTYVSTLFNGGDFLHWSQVDPGGGVSSMYTQLSNGKPVGNTAVASNGAGTLAGTLAVFTIEATATTFAPRTVDGHLLSVSSAVPDTQISDDYVTTHNRVTSKPAIAYSPSANNYLVAWSVGQSAYGGATSPPVPGIYAQLVSIAGIPTGSVIPVDLSLFAGSSPGVSVAFDGVGYVVTWATNDINIRRVMTDGTMPGAAAIVGGGIIDYPRHVVTFDGTHDIVVFAPNNPSGGNPGDSLLLARVLPSDLSVVSTHTISPNLAEPAAASTPFGKTAIAYRTATGLNVKIFTNLQNGQSCGANDNLCASGNCVNSVCCNTPCAAVCHSCTLLGMVGTCSPVTGPAGGTCGNYLNCVAGACPTTCATDVDCIATAYCDATNHCVPRHANGTACTASDQCLSNFCCVTCAAAGCNDANPCTTDSCQLSGCVHVPVTACPAGCSSAVGCGWADTDADGLNDTWETNGYIDNNCNGLNDAGDTPLPGAHVNEPDVYVKFDYMVKTGIGAHTHQPAGTAMSMVQAAYTAHHSHLHLFPTSDSITENAVVSLNAPGTLVAGCTGPDAVSFYTLKLAHFPNALRPAYHYVIFGHYNTCDSGAHCMTCPATAKSMASPPFGRTGIAELPGNDLIISLGQLFDLGVDPMPDIINAGTFMHELGHNISLHHGGSDDLIQKPNYISVMNYSYQFGIGTTSAPGPYASSTVDPSTAYHVDYSTFAGGALHEGVTNGMNACITDGSGGMSEPAGLLGGPAGDTDVAIFYANAGGTTVYGPSNATALDWDNSAPATNLNVYADVSGDGLCSVLTGFNDWAQSSPIAGVYQDTNFNLGFHCNTGNWADGAAPPDQIEDRELTGQQVFDRHKVYPFLHIQIEVRPSRIDLGSHDLVRAAALGSATFDVTRVVPTSLRFADAPPRSTSIRDFNHDGFDDIVGVFSMKDLNLSSASTSANLIGALTNSQAFGGTAPVTVVSGDKDRSDGHQSDKDQSDKDRSDRHHSGGEGNE